MLLPAVSVHDYHGVVRVAFFYHGFPYLHLLFFLFYEAADLSVLSVKFCGVSCGY